MGSSDTGLVEELWAGDGGESSRLHPLFVPPGRPDNEEKRLRVLQDQQILDTRSEVEFDSLAKIAKRAFNADISFISLVDAERVWFMAGEGYGHLQVPRELAPCAYAILEEGTETFVILDTSQDDRFRFNQIATAADSVRFYASAPLLVHRDGEVFKLGCLGIADHTARSEMSVEDRAYLAVLASAVVRQIELRPRKQRVGELPEKARAQILEGFFSRASLRVEQALIDVLAEKTLPWVVQSEHYVTRRGDPGDSMFFLSGGSCSCIFNGREIERLRAGSCFGELAVMNVCKMRAAGVSERTIQKRCVRSADIRALERCELLQFKVADAWPLIHQFPVLWKTLEAISEIRVQRIKVNSSPGI